MKVNLKKFVVPLSIALIGTNTIISNAINITDINGHWANNEITKFVNNNYILGYEDNTFKPNNSITRAEFVSILNRVFNLTTSSGKVFNDTNNHWAKQAIDIAVTNGVCNGKSNNLFYPNDKLTRQEASVMLSNYLKLQDTQLDKINSLTQDISIYNEKLKSLNSQKDDINDDIKKLNNDLNIPKSFKEAGIDEQEFLAKVDMLADRAFEDQCTTANPRLPLVSELKQILLDSYYGN